VGADGGRPALGVGMVGYSFMGRAHSQAWRTAPHVFGLPLEPRMVAIAGRSADKVEAARAELGWQDGVTDWRALLERDDIDLVDVCTPGDSHAEIAIAALDAGKHVLCEKPLATSVEEGEAMVAAAQRAAASGVRAMVGFNYRRVPALAFAQQLIAEGRLGEVRHVRAVYLQDWIVDPEFPLVWRLQAEHAGSGALGDIGAHIIDASQFLLGQEITAVSGLTETFVKERPLADASAGLSAAGSAERGAVTVDDAALFLARFAGGAIGTFEATRFATGRKNGLAIEVNGALGSLRFDLERLSELELYDARDEAETQGFRRILVTEATHPYMDAWWPPGHLIGWEHSFTHEVRDLVTAIAAGEDARPTFADGLQVERVLRAVVASAASEAWEAVG
jgi:predicted dehydrogenase